MTTQLSPHQESHDTAEHQLSIVRRQWFTITLLACVCILMVFIILNMLRKAS